MVEPSHSYFRDNVRRPPTIFKWEALCNEGKIGGGGGKPSSLLARVRTEGEARSWRVLKQVARARKRRRRGSGLPGKKGGR